MLGSGSSGFCYNKIFKEMKIGILALQGAFQEHFNVLMKISKKSNELNQFEVCLIKLEKELETCDGIILPGGESTVS